MIAYAAGRVLVDYGAIEPGPGEAFAGIAHGEGQGNRFLGVHAVEEDRHAPAKGVHPANEVKQIAEH